MKKLHFTYEMAIRYSDFVSCFFTIKCIPKDTLRQSVTAYRITLQPDAPYETGVDGFRNLQIYGAIRAPHNFFSFQIEGDAVTGLSDCEETAAPETGLIYRNPHGLNTAGPNIRAFSESIRVPADAGPTETAEALMHALFQNFQYRKEVTDVATGAEEAFSGGSGVCQDYAHILIALLHLRKIPARYVTGFIIGEGESHAWVEYLDGNRWIPIDPTNDRRVDDDYLKIGHGRDSADCAINRGIVRGTGTHTQHVRVLMQEENRGEII